MFTTKYDDSNVGSILRHAKQLEGHSLSEYLESVGQLGSYKSTVKRGRGQLGNEVEEYFFGYKPNGNPEPDFIKVGLELKVTPLRLDNKNHLLPKERLVLSKINYMNVVREDWSNNSLLKKLRFLLLMFYIHEKDAPSIDLLFELVSTWSPSDADLKIIEQDWNTIVNKVRLGKAHEISEGDTLYLGACTKAADSFVRTPQPFGNPAKPRAFSLKQSYSRAIWDELNGKRSVRLSTDVDFQKKVIDKFNSIVGLSIDKAANNLSIDANMLRISKNFLNRFMKEIQVSFFGKQLSEFDEFKKSGIQVKCILLKLDGVPKEDMSFPYIQYKDIVSQEWDKSDIKEMFENEKHLWLVFKATKKYKNQKDLALDEIIFEKAMFWNMPANDLENDMYLVWQDTVDKIKRGDYNHFMKVSENTVGHIRPKATNAKDVMETPQGTFEKKKCFWLNRKYVAEQITKPN